MRRTSESQHSREPRPHRRVLFAAGGSAGHVAVAVAAAEALVAASGGDVDLRFLGAPGGVLESRLVASAGFHQTALPAAPFRRQPPGRKLAALRALARSFAAARRELAGFRPQVVLGTGAYASVPAVLAARSLGARVLLHEANAAVGWANRLLAPLASAFLLGDLCRRAPVPCSRRALRTGTPVRREVWAARTDATPPPHERPGRLLVTAGAEGSRFLDAAGPGLAAQLLREGVADLAVRHQTGHADPASVSAAYSARGVTATVVSHLESMADAYAWADVAVSAAGAATLAELAAARLPTMVVPVASVAGGHQDANAAGFATRTGAPWFSEASWDTVAAASQLARWLTEPKIWCEAAASLGAGADVSAGARVAAAIESTLSPVTAKKIAPTA